MPKLIIKQETKRVSWIRKHARSLSLAGMLLLTGVVGFVAWSNMTISRTPETHTGALPSLATAGNTSARADYLRQDTELSALVVGYERLSALMPADEAGNTQLKDLAERILQHVFTMDDAVSAMGLAEGELQGLQQRQHYLQDLWQSRITFAELRLQRLQDLAQMNRGDAVAASEDVNELPVQAAAETTKERRALAEPPPGMELPPGFCSLSGSNACKPE